MDQHGFGGGFTSFFSLTSPLNGNKKLPVYTWPYALCFRNSGEIIYPIVNFELIIIFLALERLMNKSIQL